MAQNHRRAGAEMQRHRAGHVAVVAQEIDDAEITRLADAGDFVDHGAQRL